MRITVNIKDSLLEPLDEAAEAHHESRANYAGMLIETQITGKDIVREQFVQELEHRDAIITRQAEEIKGLRFAVEELHSEMQARSTSPVPAAGEVEQMRREAEDLRGEVHERDVRIAGLDARVGELRGKCEMLEGLMVQHFREKEMMLALLPSATEKRQGFFARLFRKRD